MLKELLLVASFVSVGAFAAAGPEALIGRCSGSFAASMAFDDPTAEEFVKIKIECDDHEEPFNAGGHPKSGEITVPSGSIVTSAAILARLIAEYEDDYYCADCTLSGCDLHGSESSGSFIYELKDIGVNSEVYSWTTSDVAIVIACSRCS